MQQTKNTLTLLLVAFICATAQAQDMPPHEQQACSSQAADRPHLTEIINTHTMCEKDTLLHLMQRHLKQFDCPEQCNGCGCKNYDKPIELKREHYERNRFDFEIESFFLPNELDFTAPMKSTISKLCIDQLLRSSPEQLNDLLIKTASQADTFYDQMRCLMATLLYLGASPNTKTSKWNEWYENETALHEVVYRSDYQLVKVFLAHGVKPILPLQSLPFTSTCITKLLLLHGAEVNYTDENGRSALHRILGPFSDISGMLMETLLNHGANANLESKETLTPLMTLALYSRGYSLMQNPLLRKRALLLLKAGANTQQRATFAEYAGMTALEIAKAQPDSESRTVLTQILEEAEQQLSPDNNKKEHTL